jgi:hypothetical protein
MQLIPFFITLNKKIEEYDKMAKNPFTMPQPIVLIWVDDESEKENQ